MARNEYSGKEEFYNALKAASKLSEVQYFIVKHDGTKTTAWWMVEKKDKPKAKEVAFVMKGKQVRVKNTHDGVNFFNSVVLHGASGMSFLTVKSDDVPAPQGVAPRNTKELQNEFTSKATKFVAYLKEIQKAIDKYHEVLQELINRDGDNAGKHREGSSLAGQWEKVVVANLKKLSTIHKDFDGAGHALYDAAANDDKLRKHVKKTAREASKEATKLNDEATLIKEDLLPQVHQIVERGQVEAKSAKSITELTKKAATAEVAVKTVIQQIDIWDAEAKRVYKIKKHNDRKQAWDGLDVEWRPKNKKSVWTTMDAAIPKLAQAVSVLHKRMPWNPEQFAQAGKTVESVGELFEQNRAKVAEAADRYDRWHEVISTIEQGGGDADIDIDDIDDNDL